MVEKTTTAGITTAVISAFILAALGIGGGNGTLEGTNQTIIVNLNQSQLAGGGGGVAEGGCSPFWQCSAWSRCVGYQTRTCLDANTCDLTLNKPDTYQRCTVPPGVSVRCGDNVCGSDEDESWCPDCAYRECTFDSDCVDSQGNKIGPFVACYDKAYPRVEGQAVSCITNLPNNQCVCSGLLYNIISFS